MRDSLPATDAFDAFYKDTRDRLLMQTLALSGDLTAARGAVRHAFIVAWHHWRKVARLPDPENYVRPLAWTHAHRVASARVFARNKGMDPELAHTLEALNKLPVQQRRVLLLNQLSALTLPEIAREVGVQQQVAERDLQTATAQFSLHRNVPSTALPLLLAPLGEVAAGVRWPRGSILRRAGSARRRGQTLLGVSAAVAATTLAGTLVSVGANSTPRLTQEELTAQAEVIQVADPPAPRPRLTPGLMIAADQVARFDAKADWTVTRTHVNTAGDGIVLACQAARYADPDGSAALVREFRGQPRKKRPATTAVEFAELSEDTKTARRTYRTVLGWFADCPTAGAHLESTRALSGVANEAMAFTVRRWGAQESVSQIGVARSGQLVTTVQVTRLGSEPVDADAAAALLAAAVNAQCGKPGADRCASPPVTQQAPVLPAPSGYGMLAAADLPRAGEIGAPWVGTTPEVATLNLAASRCDETDFAKRPFTSSLTRTYLIPDGGLPREFGLTHTIGVTPNPAAAARRTDALIAAIAGCEEKQLGTEVRRLAEEATDTTQLAAWVITTEISDQRSVTFMLGVARDRNRVAQIGFVPARGAGWSDAQFLGVAQRALARLAEAPRKSLEPPAE